MSGCVVGIRVCVMRLCGCVVSNFHQVCEPPCPELHFAALLPPRGFLVCELTAFLVPLQRDWPHRGAVTEMSVLGCSVGTLVCGPRRGDYSAGLSATSGTLH